MRSHRQQGVRGREGWPGILLSRLLKVSWDYLTGSGLVWLTAKPNCPYLVFYFVFDLVSVSYSANGCGFLRIFGGFNTTDSLVNIETKLCTILHGIVSVRMLTCILHVGGQLSMLFYFTLNKNLLWGKKDITSKGHQLDRWLIKRKPGLKLISCF